MRFDVGDMVNVMWNDTGVGEVVTGMMREEQKKGMTIKSLRNMMVGKWCNIGVHEDTTIQGKCTMWILHPVLIKSS